MISLCIPWRRGDNGAARGEPMAAQPPCGSMAAGRGYPVYPCISVYLAEPCISPYIPLYALEPVYPHISPYLCVYICVSPNMSSPYIPVCFHMYPRPGRPTTAKRPGKPRWAYPAYPRTSPYIPYTRLSLYSCISPFTFILHIRMSPYIPVYHWAEPHGG